MADETRIAEMVKQALSLGTKVDPSVVDTLRHATTVFAILPFLKDVLTSENSKDVNIAVYVLSQVAQRRSDVDAKGLVSLLEFFVGKSREYACSETAIEATAALFRDYASVADEGAVEIVLHEMLPHLHTQAMLLSTKRHIYFLVEQLLTTPRFLQVLKGAGALFPRVLLSTIDGERDPELVLKAFVFHRITCAEFDATTLAFLKDDLFEAVSAYFPILFTPPPNCAVTKDQLRDALHAAMIAPLFHEQCIPFLCGKLSSPAATVKSDAFKVLQLAFAKTALELVEPHFSEALAAVRGEVLKLTAMQEHNPDLRDVLQDAVNVITEIGRSAAGVAKKGAAALLSIAHPVVDMAVNNIETDSPSGRTYATMIFALCSGAPEIAAVVGGYLVPVLIQLAESKFDSDRRLSSCVSCLGAFLSASEAHCATLSSEAAEPIARFNRSLAVAAMKFLIALVESRTNPKRSEYTTRVAVDAAATLVALGSEAQWITREQQDAIYGAIIAVALGDDSTTPPDVRGSAVLALKNVSRVDGAHARETVAEVLCRPGDVDAEFCVTLVDGLAGVPESVEWALRLLLVSAGVGLRSTSGLLLVEKLCTTFPALAAPVARNGLERLYDAAGTASSSAPLRSDAEYLPQLIAAAKALAAALPAEEQRSWILERAVPSLLVKPGVAIATATLSRSSSSVLIRRTAALNIAAVAAAAPAVMRAIAHDDLAALTGTAIQCCSAADADEYVASASFDLLTAVANRIGVEALPTIEAKSLPPRVAAAIAKGFVVRDDPAASRFVDAVFGALLTAECEPLGDQRGAAATALGRLLEAPIGLEKKTMWQQRLFHVMIARLAPFMSDASAGVPQRVAAFEALAAMVSAVPSKLLKIASDQLTAAVTSALRAPETLSAGAQILTALSAADEELALELVLNESATLVALVRAGASTTGVPLATRKAALELVAAVGQQVTHDTDLAEAVLPVKKEVLKLVTPALNDKKRVVRQAAAKCRHYWNLIE